MTEKRFVLQDLDILCRVLDNGKPINGIETVHLLNALHEENQQLKQYKKAIWDWDSSKIIRVDMNTGEVDLVDKELEE